MMKADARLGGFFLAFGIAALVFLGLDAAWAHGVPQKDIQALIDGGPPAYVWSGAKHMITGYDHLLFLFGVMFFLTRFIDITKFITAFTLGHCITLLGGTLSGFTVNPYLIDAFIAITVSYKGIENLGGFQKWFHFTPPNLLLMVFLFGLVHGTGLATRLSGLPLGEDQLVLKILSFNLGVELGQVAALMVMAVVLSAWRRTSSFEKFSDVANKFLVFAGFMLLIYQLHGFLHTTYPDELGFSKDLHEHHHEDMQMEEQREHHRDSID